MTILVRSGPARPKAAPLRPAVSASESAPLVWWYVAAVVAVWVLFPEIRRLADWRFGYRPIDVLSVVPHLVIMPLGVLLLLRVGAVTRSMAAVAILWVASFASAMIVGVADGQITSAVFEFIQFCLPVAVGLWAATARLELPTFMRFVQRTMGVLLLVTSVYGIIQYVVAPAWDVNWLRVSGQVSMGRPFPYEIRTFSTLNAPGILGDFLALCLPFVMYRLAGVRALVAGGVIALALVTIGLTLARIVWIAMPFEFICYLALLPRRPVKTMVGFGIFLILLSGFLSANIETALPMLAPITDRAATLFNLNDDVSANYRATLIAPAVETLRETPNGLGLGLFGIAAKLNSANGYIANLEFGPLARLVEMGVIGAAGYFATVGAAFALTLAIWGRARELYDDEVQSLAAIAAAVQVGLFIMNIGGDAQFDLNGIMYWLAVGLVLGRTVHERLRLDFRARFTLRQRLRRGFAFRRAAEGA